MNLITKVRRWFRPSSQLTYPPIDGILGIVGPPISGKTTLIQHLARYVGVPCIVNIRPAPSIIGLRELARYVWADIPMRHQRWRLLTVGGAAPEQASHEIVERSSRGLFLFGARNWNPDINTTYWKLYGTRLPFEQWLFLVNHYRNAPIDTNHILEPIGISLKAAPHLEVDATSPSDHPRVLRFLEEHLVAQSPETKNTIT